MTNEFESWIGRRVFLVTKSQRKYTGIIKEVTDSFIFILDKFDEKVVINISEISTIEEEA